LEDDVVALHNPETGAVEDPEVLFFETRLLRKDVFELPLSAALLTKAPESPRYAVPNS
jgi:hypothetical protein